MNDYIKTLQKAFNDLHGCTAKHLETVPVVETFKGQMVWEGDVEVFALTGHPKAKKGYAWSYHDEKKDHITAVLEIPPVDSAETAVKIAIAASSKPR